MRPMRPSRTRALQGLLAALALLAGAVSDAQQRPLHPEPACTRVTLRAAPGANPREVSLRVENTDPGDFPARLRAAIEVQRRVGGRWQRVSAAGLTLRENCATEAPECVTLAPRASLTAAPWTGMLGDAQCRCTRCGPAPAGTYRFVVSTCEACLAPHSFESEAFELPALAPSLAGR